MNNNAEYQRALAASLETSADNNAERRYLQAEINKTIKNDEEREREIERLKKEEREIRERREILERREREEREIRERRERERELHQEEEHQLQLAIEASKQTAIENARKSSRGPSNPFASAMGPSNPFASAMGPSNPFASASATRREPSNLFERELSNASASTFARAPAQERALPPKRRLPNLPPPKTIFEEIARLISYMQSKDIDKDIMPYNDELDNYLMNGESIIKTPLFVHYHNVSFYASRRDDPNLSIQTCRFNYNNDFIYLVRQYLLYSNDTQMKGDEKFINLEFRPHAFYMKREPNYEVGTNLSFKGLLEIINLEQNKIISKNMVEVLSHHGIFSPGQNLLSFEELGINKDDDTKNYFFYVKFTPYNNPENNPYNSVFEIFRGIYWLSMMPEHLKKETCKSMLDTILSNTAIRGGSYSKRKLKNKSNKHKSIKHKSNKHKSNKHNSIKYKSIHKNKHKTYKTNKIHKTNKKT
jgi:hypothetical protein